MIEQKESRGGDETAATDTMYPFVVPCPDNESGWTIKKCPYSGPIPLKVMVFLNNVFLGCEPKRYFNPIDPMDAYQSIFVALEKRAGEPIDSEKADPIKFLKGVVMMLFKNYYTKHVAPVKAKNEKLQALIAAAKYDEDDDEKDIHLMDLVPDKKAEVELPLDITIQEFGEVVKYLPYSPTREAMAKAFVNKMFMCFEKMVEESDNPIAKEALEIFGYYLDFNGNMKAIWEAMQISRTTFFQKWNYCRKFARRMCAQMTL